MTPTLGRFAAFVFMVAPAWGALYQFDASLRKASLSMRPTHRDQGSDFELTLKVPRVEITTNADGFQNVSIDGLSPLQTFGYPALFATGGIIAVPDGQRLTWELAEEETRIIPDVLIAPAQAHTRCDCVAPSPFRFDAALYQGSRSFPRESSVFEDVGRLPGLRLVRVGLYPLRVDFRSRTLTVSTKLSVILRLTGKPARTSLPHALYDAVKSGALNGSALGSMQKSTEPDRMLVIVADRLKTKLTRFIDWKRSLGMLVDVYTVSQAGETKEKIQNFIRTQHARAANKHAYLLLVGSTALLPTFVVETPTAGFLYRKSASDHPYTVLNDSDNIPALLYGRFIAGSPDELDTMIDKSIAYERRIIQQGNWQGRALTIASLEGDAISDRDYAEKVSDQLKTKGIQYVESLFQDEETAVTKNIFESVEDGKGWLAYFGHGDGVSWTSLNDATPIKKLNVLNIRRELRNSEKTPLVVDVACLNADHLGLYVNSTTESENPDTIFAKGDQFESFAHAWTSNPAGAVAYVGGGTAITWHEPALLSVGMATVHGENRAETLGETYLAGQLFVMAKMGVGPNVQDNLRWFHVLGDPSLRIRTGPPRRYSVQLKSKETGVRVRYTLIARDPDEKPVPNLTMALSDEDWNPLAIAKSNERGEATLSVLSGSFNALTLTTSGYNRETQQKPID